MKKTILLFFLGIPFLGYCQQLNAGVKNLILEISYAKTTTLVFPSAVEYVDCGNPSILVSAVKSEGRCLLVKAAKSFIHSSSLTVFTSGKKIYTFRVMLADSLKEQVWFVKNEDSVQNEKSTELNDSSLVTTFSTLHQAHYRKRKKSSQLFVELDSLKYVDEKLFFSFRIANQSRVPFSIQSIDAFIQHKKERSEVHPHDIIPALPVKVENQQVTEVISFSKFYLSGHQHLFIRFSDFTTGRSIVLRIKKKWIDVPAVN